MGYRLLSKAAFQMGSVLDAGSGAVVENENGSG